MLKRNLKLRKISWRSRLLWFGDGNECYFNS